MGAIKRNIPNFITCLNLVCGCLGILLLFNGMPIEASCLMFLAAFLDLFDGLIARALKVSSPIGKDLDSLADVISFGVLPRSEERRVGKESRSRWSASARASAPT